MKRRLGAKILRAVASPLRLNILRMLYDRGSLSYTEIMNNLKLSPSRDAGRFAYHLKTLTSMNLIASDPNSRKYYITELGRSLVEFADDIENSIYREQMLVRTSRLAIERFDRNKIAESLVREASVPADLAQKIAREAERRLLKLGTKYLTAPLIREFVNAILIEKGLEEYRHKMTRLGFPVYDVTLIMKELSRKSADVEDVQIIAGRRVMGEYTLLNVLPRKVADAHISGEIHITNLGSWILKPSIFMHDARFFIQYGLLPGSPLKINVTERPKSLRSAFSLLINVLQLAASEISLEQVFDFLNVFLAPFAKDMPPEDIKEEISLFLASINLTVPTEASFGLEIGIPQFLAEHKAFGYGGREVGIYGDFIDESLLLASAFLEGLRESLEKKPLLNPAVIIKIRNGIHGECEEILRLAHELAINGLPYFANLLPKYQRHASYAAMGVRFIGDWKRDWEIDTIRTGCMDEVIVNIPRAAYESDKDEDKFFEKIREFAEKGLEALRIKHRTIESRANEGLLPFLLQRKEGDYYFRIDNSLSILSFVGLNEALQFMIGETIQESSHALSFADRVISFLTDNIERYGRKAGMRFKLGLPYDFEAATRLAQLDIEKYGLGTVLTQGERERPYYTNLNIVPHYAEIPLEEYLKIESHMQKIIPGSHLAKISLSNLEASPEELFSITRSIIDHYNIGFYTYDQPLTHCSNCQRTWRGKLLKCPLCKSVNTLIQFERETSRYRLETA